MKAKKQVVEMKNQQAEGAVAGHRKKNTSMEGKKNQAGRGKIGSIAYFYAQ